MTNYLYYIGRFDPVKKVWINLLDGGSFVGTCSYMAGCSECLQILTWTEPWYVFVTEVSYYLPDKDSLKTSIDRTKDLHLESRFINCKLHTIVYVWPLSILFCMSIVDGASLLFMQYTLNLCVALYSTMIAKGLHIWSITANLFL